MIDPFLIIMLKMNEDSTQKAIPNQSEKIIVIDADSLAILKQNIEDGVRSIIREGMKIEAEKKQTLCYKIHRFLKYLHFI